MPNVKAGVNFWPGMHPRLEADMEKIDRLHIRLGCSRPAFITSARDSKHKEQSKHYAGRALDLRTNDLSPTLKRRLAKDLALLLGPDYFVDLEYEGRPNEHIHLQYNGPD